MSQPDNKTLDIQRIRAFIEARGGSEVPVEDIMEHSGAERLRVYPILFEMEQASWLEVTSEGELGAPVSVRRRQ